MKRKTRRACSIMLCTMLLISLNINPIAIIFGAVADTGIFVRFGNIGKNIVYWMEGNPINVFADDDDTVNVTVDCDCPDYSDVLENIEDNTNTIVANQEAAEKLLTDSYATVQIIQQSLDGTIHGDLQTLDSDVKAINNTLMTTIHQDLNGIKDQIALQQHNYRVATVYSLNSTIPTCYWHPSLDELDWVKDYAIVSGSFANVYTGAWDLYNSTVDKPQGASRALEVLGYDAIVRQEGVVVRGAALNTAPSGTDPTFNASETLEVPDITDYAVKKYFQILIPEKDITWLDAVTVLYKAVGQEQYTMQAYRLHDESMTPENSPAWQNLANPVPGDDGKYQGYNQYVFVSRSNMIVSTNGDSVNGAKVNNIYWTKALQDGFVDNTRQIDQPITGSDFWILASKMMDTYGEPVINQSETDALLQVYGKNYPVQLGPEIADAWAYLVARGCMDDNMSPSSKIDRDTLIDICGRIKDTSMRTDYKTIQITLDLSDVMVSNGYYPVKDMAFDDGGSVGVTEIIDYKAAGYYDLFVIKSAETNTELVDSTGNACTEYYFVYDPSVKLIDDQGGLIPKDELAKKYGVESVYINGVTLKEQNFKYGDKTYFHILSNKDVHQNIYIVGLRRFDNGTYSQSTNFICIPTAQLGGGFYSMTSQSGNIVSTSSQGIQLFNTLGDDSLLRYVDWLRSGDPDPTTVAKAPDATLFESLAFDWNYITTDLEVLADDYDHDNNSAHSTVKIHLGNLSAQTQSDLLNVDLNAQIGQTQGGVGHHYAKDKNSVAALLFRMTTLMEHSQVKGTTTAQLKNVVNWMKGAGIPESAVSSSGIYKYMFSGSDQTWSISGYSTMVTSMGYPRSTWLYRFVNASSRPYFTSSEIQQYMSSNQGQWYDGNPAIYLRTDGYKSFSAQGSQLSTLFANTDSSGKTAYNYALDDLDKIQSWISQYKIEGASLSQDGQTLTVQFNGASSTDVKNFLNEFMVAVETNDDGSADDGTLPDDALVNSGNVGDLLQNSVKTSTIMNRKEQILISWDNLVACGFAVDTFGGRQPTPDDLGLWHIMTRLGEVRINNEACLMIVGTTMYNLYDQDGYNPTLVYIQTDDETGLQKVYFDYRCVMGLANQNPISDADGNKIEFADKGAGVGSAVIYTLNSDGASSALFNSVKVNCYTMPDTPEQNPLGASFPMQVVTWTQYDGQAAESAQTSEEHIYWKDADGNDIDMPRMVLNSFFPTANWMTVIRQTDEDTSASLFVWYPRAAFTNGFSLNGNTEFPHPNSTPDLSTNYNFSSALTQAQAYESTPLKTLVQGVYQNVYGRDITSDTNVTSNFDASAGVAWYDAMSIMAYVDLWDMTSGGYYMSPNFVCREFKLTDQTPISGYRFKENGTEEEKALDEMEKPGDVYWIDCVGFVYNIPTTDDFDYQKYFDGEYPLPLAINSYSGTDPKIYNYNLDYVRSVYLDSSADAWCGDAGSIPYGYALANEGLVDVGNGNNVIKSSNELKHNSDGFIICLEENQDKFDYDNSSLIYAPVAPYCYINGTMADTVSIKNITDVQTQTDSVFWGSRRLFFDRTENGNPYFFRGTKTYASLQYPVDDHGFDVVYQSRGYNVLVHQGAGVISGGSNGNIVPKIEDYSPNALTNWFEGIGLKALLNKIDEGASWLIIFTFQVMPIIGIILMTILVGLSFISEQKIVQLLCDKFIDPVRILTFGNRDIYNWPWRKVLWPCMIMYLSFALFLNGNLIRIIMWLAKAYDVVSNMISRTF